MTWQTKRTMSADEFARIIKALGMSQAGAGRFLGTSERTARRMVAGTAAIPIACVLLLRSMLHHKDKPEVPKWHPQGN